MFQYLVQHYLDSSFSQFPDRLAVADGRDEWTCRDLYLRSNKLAHCLRDAGVKKGARVAFCLRRSVLAIEAIEGILKADGIYVPLDHGAPAERLSSILDDCRPTVIICDARTIGKIEQVLADATSRPGIVILGQASIPEAAASKDYVLQDQIDGCAADRPQYESIDTDVAYVLYTSGSTGKPKGVMISHRSVRDYIDWAADFFRVTSGDRFLGTAPFHFDMSTFDVHCPIKTGAALCVAPEEALLFPPKLLQFMEKHGVTIWKGVSSLLMYLARTGALSSERAPSLRKVLFGGESLPAKYVAQWMNAFPDKEFHNVYGPTECTGVSTTYHLDSAPADFDAPIPIGKPCWNTGAFVLNDQNMPAGVGEPGELCIRGTCVSVGYWNNPEPASAAFFQYKLPGEVHEQRTYRTGDIAYLRDDDNFILVGRKDDQVKWMGYRIELSDIERSLLSLEGVKDAAVTLRESGSYDLSELVGFVEMEGKAGIDGLLGKLRAKLPPYMMPKRIIKIGRIPRTSRGKLDRKHLAGIEG